MSKSRFERNWERAGQFLMGVGSRVVPVAAGTVVAGSAVTNAAGAGIDAVAQRVRRLSNPGGKRAVMRKLEKSADYLRYRASRDIARDAWRTVNRKPVWIAASSALGGWIAYRWLSRD